MSESEPAITKHLSTHDHCLECGKRINAELPLGVCADCSLRNVLNDSFQRTADLESQALIEHPEKDVTIDEHGRSTLVDPFRAGQRIGQFEIIRRLGRGGMGTVYEAQDSQNHRRVALKVLNRAVENDAARHRFLREGRLAASINHPNSVFVFGTHQIQSHSLISMELVSGGTLEQRVRAQGPLPSRQAVDVALQIIDGLDAAYSSGILHRDIKPANCFEDADGTVKVGDFGLSISTEPEVDARVTTEGVFLGTPAFSSPEQLRGDGLDVRSDIYALGVTLYYLLTGRTPYQADSLVKLLSQVFEKSAPSPRSVRPEISKELSQLVMRCLAKEPGDRFLSYADLREALIPHSSRAPEAASLGLRMVAGVVDWTVLGSVGLVYAAVTSHATEPVLWSSHVASRVGALLFVLLYIFYFAICESVYGRTVGKKLLGLKTTQLDGDRPSLRQSAQRAAIFILVPCVIVLPYNLLFRVGASITNPTLDTNFVVSILVGWSRWCIFALLFSTARNRNGMATVHGLVSQTRVVSSVNETPAARLESESTSASVSGEGEIGPYRILQTIVTNEAANFHVAYDPMLLRKVWLRCDGTPGQRSQETRLQSTRATRLRWLNQFEFEGKNWDVYEAPTGGPLLDRIRSDPNARRQLGGWLSDLAQEIEKSVADGSVPVDLTVEQLWLTNTNRLKVLGISAPGLSAAGLSVPGTVTPDGAVTKAAAVVPPTTTKLDQQKPETTEQRSPSQRWQTLLRDLSVQVRSALTTQAALTTQKSSKLPPPLYVTRLLTEWETNDNLEDVVQMTRAASQRRPVSMKQRRILMSAAYYAIPISQIVIMLLYQMLSGLFFAQNEDLRQLRALVDVVNETENCKDAWKLEEVVASSPELAARLDPEIERYYQYKAAKSLIAGEHQGILEDPRMKSVPALMHFYPAIREKISAVQNETQPTKAEIEAAVPLLAQTLAKKEAEANNGIFSGFGMGLLIGIGSWVCYVAFPAILAGLLCRGGLVVHGFQTVIVRMNGQPAGRIRVFLRAILEAIPGIAMLFCMSVRQVGLIQSSEVLLTASLLGLTAVVVVFYNLRRTRGLADRLMGTALVSR